MRSRKDLHIKALWIVLFLLSLGASITLNLFSEQKVPSQTDLAYEGWLTLAYPDGRTYFYKESVGTIKQDSDKTIQNDPWSLLNKAPFSFIFQLVILSIGLLLVLLKKPIPIGLSHRLNIAFGFLIIAWLNFAVFVLRFAMPPLSNIPVGYVRVVSREQGITMLSAEAIIISLALGLGTSILLSYFWIRWARASRPEEYFV